MTCPALVQERMKSLNTHNSTTQDLQHTNLDNILKFFKEILYDTDITNCKQKKPNQEAKL